jgi:hypothetical protein
MDNKKEILINKIGLSEEVVDFILLITDKHYIWLGNEIKKQPSLFFTKKEDALIILVPVNISSKTIKISP